MAIRLRPEYVKATLDAYKNNPENPEVQVKVVDISRRAPLFVVAYALGMYEYILSNLSRYESVRKINSAMQTYDKTQLPSLLKEIEAEFTGESEEVDEEDELDTTDSTDEKVSAKRGRKAKGATAVVVKDEDQAEMEALFDTL